MELNMKKLKVKTKKNNIFMAFFVTALIITVAISGMWVMYKVESMMNIDPIVVLAITNNTKGLYHFRIFGFEGSIDFNKIHDFFNKTKNVTPSAVKLLLSAVDCTVNYGAKLLAVH